ncbi:hypothetical protein F2Q69_00014655 [Brassica cretica]|uniref:Uncharacterized protein n=1 Tax=Brassica cretica TaxID=69181 RepID=A0A8S9QUP9_BRACR|nr:hypothetical protein F2Q69_00014655 [Brassica cretica]
MPRDIRDQCAGFRPRPRFTPGFRGCNDLVRDRCFAMLQGISLCPAFGKHSGLTTDVCSQNCCSCLDLICDRGVRTKGSRKFVPGKRHPPIPCFVWCWPSEISFGRQVIGAVVAQLFWLCMKVVLSFIAKDVVAKGLDHDTFRLSGVLLPMAFYMVCKLAGFLKTLEYWQRDKFWDLVSRFLILCLEMLETSALGLGQDLAIGSRLIRLVWLEPSISPRTIFKPPGSADQKFWVSFIALLSLCRMYESHLYEMAKCFAMLQEISLSYAFRKHSGLTTDVHSQNCCSCLDLICDRGVRTKWSRKFVPGKRRPPIPCFVCRQVIGAVVAQLFWLCMKAVLSFIAKDVVAKGLDHDTFVLSIMSSREIKPKKLDTEPVRSQLRVCKLAGFLKTLEYWQRDKFWDLVSRFLILCLEMLETSALGLGQDLGLLLVLEGAMTNSTYVSRFSFILIPYRFKVRDRCFAMLQGISLSPAFGKHSGLTTYVRSQNCCSCLDLICDRGVRTKGMLCIAIGALLRVFFTCRILRVKHSGLKVNRSIWNLVDFKTNSGLPFSRQVIGAVVTQLFWLCMKDVLSFIAKDVVAKGLDHDTFVLEIKPKKLDTEPVRGQLRGGFLLGCDQAE